MHFSTLTAYGSPKYFRRIIHAIRALFAWSLSCNIYSPPGITRGELVVSYSKLAEISRNSRGLYWWVNIAIIIVK